MLETLTKQPIQSEVWKHQKRSETYSKLAIKTPERRHWRHSGAFIDKFEHIPHLFLELLLLALNRHFFARNSIFWSFVAALQKDFMKIEST